MALVASERTGKIKKNSSDSLLILQLLHAGDIHHVKCFEQSPYRKEREWPMRHVVIVEDPRLTTPGLLIDVVRQYRDLEIESGSEQRGAQAVRRLWQYGAAVLHRWPE